MMKKLLMMLCIATLGLSLAACGGNDDEKNKTTTTEKEVVTTAAREDVTTEAAAVTDTSAEETTKAEHTTKAEETTKADPVTDETDYYEDEAIPVLGFVPSIPKIQPIETRPDYHNGYYYADLTEDGATTIENQAFPTTIDTSETTEAYAKRCAKEVSGAKKLTDFYMEPHEGLSAKLSYPVDYMVWYAGKNEDLRVWEGIIMRTDTHTYIITFASYVDMFEDALPSWYDMFDQVEFIGE